MTKRDYKKCFTYADDQRKEMSIFGDIFAALVVFLIIVGVILYLIIWG
jgi:hypothetical protein